MYDVTYRAASVSTTGTSGIQKTLIIDNLTPATVYSFSISASDAAGNNAANNDILIAAITLDDGLSVDDPEFDSMVTLYPNPADKIVYINSKLSEISLIEVYSLLGAKILESDKHSIYVESLQNGIYLIKIRSDDRTITKKLVVKK